MTGYLRQIAARSAGLHPAAVSIAPPRVLSFLTQPPILPPARPFSLPGEDRGPATEPTAGSSAAPAAHVEATPSVEGRSASASQRSEVPEMRPDPSIATESHRREATEMRPDHSVAADAAESPASAAPSHGMVEPSLPRFEPMSSARPLPSSPSEPSPIASRPSTVALTPADAWPPQRVEKTNVEIPVPVPAGVDRPAPALPVEVRSMNEPASQETEPLNHEGPAIAENSVRRVVPIEPVIHPAAPEIPSRPAAALDDESVAFETRLPPSLPRERIVTAPPRRQEVRVTIGRVDVRVESNTPRAPVVPHPAAPSDPFASLALARRGWRSTF